MDDLTPRKAFETSREYLSSHLRHSGMVVNVSADMRFFGLA